MRAEALARRGEHAAAVEFARAAVEIAAATDALLDHADARMALASVLRAAGRAVEASAEETRAIELWEAKGATLLVERARAGVAGATSPAPAAQAAPSAAAAPRRRVHANAAIANAARVEAAVAARSLAAYEAALAEGAEVIHHGAGLSYTEEQARRATETLMAAEDLVFEHEPLAALGDSLALLRWRSASSGGRIPVFGDMGAGEGVWIVLAEVDAQGLRRRTEFFAAERLGDAIVRLYERYAELQPEGPARERAAAAARSVAALPLRGPFDLDRYASAFAADVDWLDHRTVGVGSLRGAEVIRRSIRSLLDLIAESVDRVDDILALRSDAVLVRWTNSGTDRVSGGRFDRPLIMLWVFGTDGLVTRFEQFEANRDAEALARFAALAGAAQTTKSVRRLRANAASDFAARLDAAVAAKDAGALRALFAEDMQVAHHPTGTHFGRDGVLSRFDALLRAQDLRLFHESIATLGESLVLCRASTSASSLAEDDIAPAGAIHTETNVVIEVDALGREHAVEIFAADRLADATTCLYERYAAQLPEGAERERAAATARTLAPLLHASGEFDPERALASFASDFEGVDHRSAGFGSVRGARGFVRVLSSVYEVADDVVESCDDVLALRPDALLLRRTLSGRNRASGGAFESPTFSLLLLNATGLIARAEAFGVEQVEQALARFDVLTGAAAPREPAPASPRRVRPNAATANTARIDAAVAARDLDAFLAELAEGADAVNHSLGVEYAERDARRGYELMLASENLRFGHEPLATLGDGLALCRSTLAIDAAVAEVVPAGVSDMSGILAGGGGRARPAPSHGVLRCRPPRRRDRASVRAPRGTAARGAGARARQRNRPLRREGDRLVRSRSLSGRARARHRVHGSSAPGLRLLSRSRGIPARRTHVQRDGE